jgi:predicted ATP-dependent serine protease
MSNLKLLRLSDVPEEAVRWLWYPYLPRGKLTIVQGDPGEGKTTFVLALVALLTTGRPMPESLAATESCNVIYQTAEDGLGDTIKPRLSSLGADCSRVLVIDESKRELSMNDERLEEAVIKTKAKLLVLDPIQAYLGGDVECTAPMKSAPSSSGWD